MVYYILFGLAFSLILLSFILLLIGFINPRISLFWYKKKTRVSSFIIYSLSLVISIIITFAIGISYPKITVKGNTSDPKSIESMSKNITDKIIADKKKKPKKIDIVSIAYMEKMVEMKDKELREFLSDSANCSLSQDTLKTYTYSEYMGFPVPDAPILELTKVKNSKVLKVSVLSNKSLDNFSSSLQKSGYKESEKNIYLSKNYKIEIDEDRKNEAHSIYIYGLY